MVLIMSATEKKEIKEQLRQNKIQQAQLNTQADEIKQKRIRLRNERASLLVSAEKLGMKFGKNRAGA